MSAMADFANLVLRQADNVEPAAEEKPACGGMNEYDGRMGLRIAAVFVILIGSSFGMFRFRARTTDI
jgi:zinc transporter 1/2/3